MWHYSRADSEAMVKSAIEHVDWVRELSPLSPDEQVDFFNETIMNIAKNFIPNNEKIYNPREPPWLTISCKNTYH